MNLDQAIEKAKSDSKERKFKQSLEVFVNFKNLDMSKDQNKVNLTVILPNGRGKKQKGLLICEDELASKSKGKIEKVIMGAELEAIGKNKKKVKRLANEYDFFISQANLMPLVGRYFGQALGPRGKMPTPVPPNADITPIVERMQKTVVIKTKGKNMPVIHAPIGTEDMDNSQLTANARAVLSAVRDSLPERDNNIKSMYVKTTMGPVIQIDEAL